MASLRAYLDALSRSGIGRSLYVDGSFVTREEEPNDIDVLLVLRDETDLAHEVPPFEYNVRSGKFLRKHLNIDFFFGFEGDSSSKRMLELFWRVKGYPHLEKGILRLVL